MWLFFLRFAMSFKFSPPLKIEQAGMLAHHFYLTPVARRAPNTFTILLANRGEEGTRFWEGVGEQDTISHLVGTKT